MTIHLVYPHGPSIAAPHIIGRSLYHALSETYEVRIYDWDEIRVIHPVPGDILIGHPHPLPGTIFRRSFRQDGWHKRITMSPFVCDRQAAVNDYFVRRGDAYLAITGTYWFDQVPNSRYAHWLPKMKHLDLAVNPDDFPRIKATFADPGTRRFLYIGHDNWQKNTTYLASIALARPEWDFSWLGHSASPASWINMLGVRDTADLDTRAIIASHDFMITVGSADANPTTILESMSWGLIPVCTPQSGYDTEAGVVNIPLNNLDEALRILDRLQSANFSILDTLRHKNDARLRDHFTWARFCDQVEDSIADLNPSEVILNSSIADRIAMRVESVLSTQGPFRAEGLRWSKQAILQHHRSRKNDKTDRFRI